MTTLTSRRTARAELRTVLAAITSPVAFAVVYDHQSKDFGRLSPVAMIHSDGTQTRFPGYADENHRFIVTWLWARTDAPAVEDSMDDMSQAVRQAIYDALLSGTYTDWIDIHFDEEFSTMDYIIIDGIMYRREQLPVTVHVVST